MKIKFQARECKSSQAYCKICQEDIERGEKILELKLEMIYIVCPECALKMAEDIKKIMTVHNENILFSKKKLTLD